MPRLVHDPRQGAGYGYTGRKGFQSHPTTAGNTFPYSEEGDRDDEDLDDDELDLRAAVNKRLSYGNLARPPETYSRTDRFTVAKNRLNLAENDTPRTTLSGLVPFPMRKFDGPAIGGSSSNPSYTVAPGRIDGSPYGWTKGALSPLLPGPEAPMRFMDVIDPSVRERVKRNLKISRIK
jgi:hypothetical protein